MDSYFSHSISSRTIMAESNRSKDERWNPRRGEQSGAMEPSKDAAADTQRGSECKVAEHSGTQ